MSPACDPCVEADTVAAHSTCREQARAVGEATALELATTWQPADRQEVLAAQRRIIVALAPKPEAP
jgi:hypothetical protein